MSGIGWLVGGALFGFFFLNRKIMPIYWKNLAEVQQFTKWLLDNTFSCLHLQSSFPLKPSTIHKTISYLSIDKGSLSKRSCSTSQADRSFSVKGQSWNQILAIQDIFASLHMPWFFFLLTVFQVLLNSCLPSQNCTSTPRHCAAVTFLDFRMDCPLQFFVQRVLVNGIKCFWKHLSQASKMQ